MFSHLLVDPHRVKRALSRVFYVFLNDKNNLLAGPFLSNDMNSGCGLLPMLLADACDACIIKDKICLLKKFIVIKRKHKHDK